VQQGKDRLGQEEEPAPVDRVDKALDALGLVFADGFPFLGAGKELGGDLGAGAGRQALGRQDGLGLVDVL